MAYQPSQQRHFLELIAAHPVAVNVFMVVILAVGAFSISRLNIQFLPEIQVNFITVTTNWPGAAAEDVERSITNRLELDLKNLDELKQMTSYSSLGSSVVVLEYGENADIDTAKDDVSRIVDPLVRLLPENAERPEIVALRIYEDVARLIVSAPSLEQLRTLANEFRDELLRRGIERIEILGLPQEEIAIQIPGESLRDLGLSLNQIGRIIQSQSKDESIGISGRDDAARQIRVLDQRRDYIEFEQVPIAADSDGRLIMLSDIATIEQRPKPDQLQASFKNRPAVELRIKRLGSGDTLKSAKILKDWKAEAESVLPADVELSIYTDQSISLQGRLDTLVNNGLIGLLLVLVVLYLFLNARLAFWVAVGIPIALSGALALLLALGGTLNMITMFGFIMTIGILVDDAIVVGEEALSQFEEKPHPLKAAYGAARRLLIPVLAASLTTILAFLPVILATGVIGTFLGFIALVVVCVVLTSLIEAFLILPGHLRGSFQKMQYNIARAKSTVMDRILSVVRDRWYRSALKLSIRHPITVIATGISLLILTVGLFTSGRLSYSFFPTPELNLLFANVSFSAGTPEKTVDEYMEYAYDALLETESDLGGNLIVSSLIFHGANFNVSSDSLIRGSNNGNIMVDLVHSDDRDVRTTEFVRRWESKLKHVPGLEKLVVVTPLGGPPGRDVEVRFSGSDKTVVKSAALELSEYLREIPGVYAIEDDTSYGRQQQILSLTPLGEALGLSVADVSQQLRASIEGLTLQSFTTRNQEIDVRLMLPDSEKHQLSEFENIHVILPSGESIALLDVVEIESSRGFDTLRHADGEFAIEVNASVDPRIANITDVSTFLDEEVRPAIIAKHGVKWSVGSRQEDQERTEESMRNGFILAMALIYLTLALVFGSYIWPVVVMLTIPFGIVGALWGHLFLGLDFTILTMLGIIGLSGIVVNNAIVLIVFYKQNRYDAGKNLEQAMLDAGCQRLRPIVLSSLTTIVGLTPLLFEKSTQAQFLIPMAATLVFGLAFSTVLVLFFIPSLLAVIERILDRLRRSEPGLEGAEEVSESA
ncbi:MAG: efflux RND transporter permease subunit [Acidiferrobacterales bacterium]|nr:efflux RND transporter permease subunit [Acidiferrobacterales bacterium]